MTVAGIGREESQIKNRKSKIENMIDGNDTTVDWQRHDGEVCILPVGAFEQHSAHLPLDTDNIEADHFGRILAEDLDATLLPTLRFATSLEHTGFRGTVTLRPETAMRVIRDIADEVERQNFTILIVVNSHGGNFFLKPVIRDINRVNRPLKVLEVYPWDFIDADLRAAALAEHPGGEIHCTDEETSVMLVLAPDRVHMDRCRDRKPDTSTKNVYPLEQSDLTTFGVRHFAPAGAVGYPSFATAEKGRAILEAIRRNMAPVVKDRIERLGKDRLY